MAKLVPDTAGATATSQRLSELPMAAAERSSGTTSRLLLRSLTADARGGPGRPGLCKQEANSRASACGRQRVNNQTEGHAAFHL